MIELILNNGRKCSVDDTTNIVGEKLDFIIIQFHDCSSKDENWLKEKFQLDFSITRHFEDIEVSSHYLERGNQVSFNFSVPYYNQVDRMVEEQVFIIASANRIFLFTSSILDEYLSTIYGSKTLNAEKLSSLKTDLLTFPFEFMSDYYADITENLAKIIKVLANCIALPTFVAGVYGMNFEKMPELHWSFGYPLAILVMIMSCILPYFYIKKKKWL